MKKSIINAINSISSTKEMNEAIELLKAKQKQIRSIESAAARSTFSSGDHVVINSRKSGRLTGIIEKVNRTKAVVSIDAVLYTVPLTMLNAA
jgi:hypothetical protein